MEEREIENVAPEADPEDTVLASVPPTHSVEAKPKKSRRVWRIVAVIVGIILLVGIGTVLGGGLVYARMGGRSARHAGIVIVPRLLGRGDGFFFSRSSREFEFPDVRCHFDLDSSEVIEDGVLVLDVMDDSPAAAAGLETCDIITRVDGKSVEDAASLSDAIAAHEPGDEVTLKVFKADEAETVEMTVTLDEHPDDEALAYLGVRAGGAFKLDVVCGEEDCDSRLFEHLEELSIELGDELHWLPGEDNGIRFFISPGERPGPMFWYHWRSGRNGIRLSIDHGDEM
ncbi:MAG: PDZ domain-containing protein [Anaerolineae bacterium]|nr:PDZ domain-containing protein [Anaerolineae bacterium]